MRISVLALLTLMLTHSAWAQGPVTFADATLKAAVEDALWVLDPTPSDMLGLRELTSVNSGITDISGLAHAKNLQHLNLRFNDISDISELAGLTQLRHLDLSRNYEISSVSALSDMVNLTYLNLHINRITSISALSGMTDLTFLDLHGNRISDITALSGMDKLQHLALNENRVKDIRALAGLEQLDKLYLHYNQIQDISPLAGLTSIHTLNIYLNEIEDISVLAGLPNLQVLSLHYNQINDISALTNLTQLTQLRMQDNPLDRSACDIDLPQILANNPGVHVEYDRCDGGHVLTISSTEGGSVTEPGEGPQTYEQAVTVSLTASAQTGYRFRNWTGTAVTAGKLGSSDNAQTTVTVDGDYTLVAQFSSDELGCPAVSTHGAKQIAQSSAILAASLVKDGGEACNGQFNYWIKGNKQESLSVTPVQDGLERHQIFSKRVHDLKAGVTYCYVAKVENSVCADEGNVREFTTTQPARLPVLYVDDDASGDPAPYQKSESDPLEDGTIEHPYDGIQEAIDAAVNGTRVLVRAGTYYETIDFLGKQILLTGIEPNEPKAQGLPVIDGAGAGPVVRFAHGEDPNSHLHGFMIVGGRADLAGGIHCIGSSPRISHCLIVGNRALDPNGAGVYCADSQAVFVHCTLADNVGGRQGAGIRLVDSHVTLMNSIVWGNAPQDMLVGDNSIGAVSYSNVLDVAGLGNIGVDPLFVEPGYWAYGHDPNILAEPADENSIWMHGDYHLVSQAGHWDPGLQIWLQDDLTSPCIDMGDPQGPAALEPLPNGGIVNLGAYGNTAEASKSH